MGSGYSCRARASSQAPQALATRKLASQTQRCNIMVLLYRCSRRIGGLSMGILPQRRHVPKDQ